MANILCVVAHADDETLGCGGTLARHTDSGDRVGVIVLADGESSRAGGDAEGIDRRRKAATDAFECLGVQWQRFLDFPDNRLDQIPLLDIIQAVEPLIAEFQAQTLYTHHAGDLNVDHRLTHQAVLTACRPVPGAVTKQILSFEVQSSTEWQSPHYGSSFRPNYFVDISACLEKKLQALSCYSNELRDFPHSRSVQAIANLAALRGSSVGVEAAEAFMVERIVNHK